MKKRLNGAWVTTSPLKYGTDTNNITSFPATVISDGTNASVDIIGNMAQNGTPTPESPIFPTECGELVSGNYTIPIISGGVTTSVNLGEVETTRKIKKLVLTGQETRWYKSGAYQGSFYLGGVSPAPISLTEQAYCSHAEFTSIATYAQNKFCFNGSPINLNLWIGESSWTTDDFKAYLAQQYAAGTPVTVWYILAEPTTGIVNEPIRKIGEYADEVSGITIPTTAGSQTFNVDTTLKPSEVDLTYHGWHRTEPKERINSDWE